MDYIVKSDSDLGRMQGPRFFNTKAAAVLYAKEANAAILPHVARFEVFTLKKIG
jgi:hypothetical protein